MPSLTISSSRLPIRLLVFAEDDPARRGLRLPAHDIEQRRFAGSVRTDHDPKLVVVDNEVEIVQRLEAVVIDDDAFESR